MFYTLAPSALLSGYVRFFWVFEGDASAGKPYIHRSMADCCAEIVFNYRARLDPLESGSHPGSSFYSGIHGPTQTFRRFAANDNFGIFGAYIYPFAIPLFFGTPCKALHNQLLDIQSLLGSRGLELEEKIMNAKNHLERKEILSSFLEQQLIRNLQPASSIILSMNNIIHSGGTMNIGELAKESFLSRRQFGRRFREYSGLSPKLFSRITRFQTTLEEYGKKHKSLTGIAYDCGYYDQSHFIKDFIEFSGFQPSHYFSGMAPEGTAWKDQ
jgi:AraC-like DNA-binding protein